MDRARLAVALLLAGAGSAPAWSQETDAARITEAALRGAASTAVASQAVIQMFTELDSGGIQRVVVRDPGDESQARLVRRRLRDVRDAFLLGDIPRPVYLPDTDMPALAQLRSAAPGSILVGYRDIPHGGELTFHARDAALVAVLHAWFNAQAADPDANAVMAHKRLPASNTGR